MTHSNGNWMNDDQRSAIRDAAEARIRRTAIAAIETMETPINGEPSIEVVNRENAIRLLSAAFEAVWQEVLGER